MINHPHSFAWLLARYHELGDQEWNGVRVPARLLCSQRLGTGLSLCAGAPVRTAVCVEQLRWCCTRGAQRLREAVRDNGPDHSSP